MAQYTIYQNKNSQNKKEFPLLLDIQTNLLASLQTTVVIPLKKLEANK
jgi:toxin CcdB